MSYGIPEQHSVHFFLYLNLKPIVSIIPDSLQTAWA